jgi:hypothetical protein
LRVVVNPWAGVWIDGRFVDTTPFARAIPLSPGTHYVKLTHPDADPETRTVHLAPGEQQVLEVAMHLNTTPLPVPASSDDPPGAGAGAGSGSGTGVGLEDP